MKHRVPAAVVVMLVALGCSAEAPEPDEHTVVNEFAVGAAQPCGTKLADVEGVWALSNGAFNGTGSSCGGQAPSGALRYQCVEYAQRYMHERWAMPVLWPVSAAKEMCWMNPSGTTSHKTSSGYMPVKGDLAVWGASAGNPWGHVAVVKSVSGDNVVIVEQNASVAGTRTISRWATTCYVHANANTGGGSTPGTCPSGEGLYCGGNGVAGDPLKLYDCSGAGLTPVASCALGCERMPVGIDDRCAKGTTCPLGNGLYCGGNTVGGDPSTLYDCDSGSLTKVNACAGGCKKMPAGFDDKCL